MSYINRHLEAYLSHSLQRGKSVLLLGPRQTGKTTLISRLSHDLHLNLMRPDIRQRYEKDPSVLNREIEALSASAQTTVILDEVQKVPELLNVAQDLIDRNMAKFIFTGSSARKLRRHGQTNLLPGRIVTLRLAPFSASEYKPTCLEDALLDGSLPGIVTVKTPQDRDMDLASYVTTYLEEEIRAEAVVRRLGPFAQFLEYAAMDSGHTINAHKLSREIGVSTTTIRSYFQILEDCLIIDSIEPVTKTQTRKKLIKSRKYLFFDLGVRRLAAHEGRQLPAETMGHLFEQFIGLELLRTIRSKYQLMRLRFWRDPDGPEVDWIVETNQQFIPIEVKWTDTPGTKDIRHLHTFLKEYPSAQQGFVICRTPNPMKLSDQVTALPWQHLDCVFPET